MHDEMISATDALAIEGLANLGLEEEEVLKNTGLRAEDLHAMLRERDVAAERERGRVLALAAERSRLSRRVRVLELALERAGMELPAE